MGGEEPSELSKLCADKGDGIDRDVLLFHATDSPTCTRAAQLGENERTALFELLNIQPPLTEAARGGSRKDSTPSPQTPRVPLTVFHPLLVEAQRDPLLFNAIVSHNFVLGRPTSEELEKVIQNKEESTNGQSEAVTPKSDGSAKEDSEAAEVVGSTQFSSSLQHASSSGMSESNATEKDKETKKKKKQSQSTKKRKAAKVWLTDRQKYLKQFSGELEQKHHGNVDPGAVKSLVQAASLASEKGLHAMLITILALLCMPNQAEVTIDDTYMSKLAGLLPQPGMGERKSPRDLAVLLSQALGNQAHDYIVTNGEKCENVVSGHPQTFLFLYSLLSRLSDEEKIDKQLLEVALARNLMRVLSANLFHLMCTDQSPASVGLGHTSAPAPVPERNLDTISSSMGSSSFRKDAPDMAPEESTLFCKKLGAVITWFSEIDWSKNHGEDEDLKITRSSLVAQATLCWTIGLKIFFPFGKDRQQLLQNILAQQSSNNSLKAECLCARLSSHDLTKELAEDSSTSAELFELVLKSAIRDEQKEYSLDNYYPAYCEREVWGLEAGGTSQNLQQELTVPNIPVLDKPREPKEAHSENGDEERIDSAEESNTKETVTETEDMDDEELMLQQALALSLEEAPPVAPHEKKEDQHPGVDGESTATSTKEAQIQVHVNLSPVFFRLSFLWELEECTIGVSRNGSVDKDGEFGDTDQSEPSLVFQEGRCAETIELSANGSTATQKSDKDWGTAIGQLAMTKKQRIYRWSVHMDKCEKGHIFVGVATKSANSSTYLGGDRHGWGLIGTKLLWHNRNKLRSFGSGFRSNDTVHVTLDTHAGTLSYACTRNGTRSEWGVAFRNMGDILSNDKSLYPAIALYQKSDAVTLIGCDDGPALPTSPSMVMRHFSSKNRRSSASAFGGSSLLSFGSSSLLEHYRSRIVAMATVNAQLSISNQRGLPDAVICQLETLVRLVHESPDSRTVILPLLKPLLARIILWNNVRLPQSLRVLQCAVQLLEWSSSKGHANRPQVSPEGRWTLVTGDARDGIELELSEVTDSEDTYSEDAEMISGCTILSGTISKQKEGLVNVVGTFSGNRLELLEGTGSSQLFYSGRLMPGGALAMGTFKGESLVKPKEFVAFHSSPKHLSFDDTCKALLGSIAGKMAALLSYVSVSSPAVDAMDNSSGDDKFDYEKLLCSPLLENGFSQHAIENFLKSRASSLSDGKRILMLSGYSFATPIATVQNTGSKELAQVPKPVHRSQDAKAPAALADANAWGITCSKDIAFLQAMIRGEDEEVTQFDQWMMRFAGKSAFLNVGGAQMQAARLSSIAAMLVHTGLLQEARLLFLWLEQTDDALQISDEDSSTQPSRMLIGIWRAAQRTIEWAIRSKQQSGSTYAVLAEKIQAKALFLLQLRPGPVPFLDYRALGISKKLSSENLEALRVDTTSSLMSPTSPQGGQIVDISLSQLCTADVVDRLLAENEIITRDSEEGVLLHVLEQWRQVARYVTRKSCGNLTHSSVLEQVVLFLKGAFNTSRVESCMLEGAWRAVQRAAGLNVFAMLIGSRSRDKQISPALFGCKSTIKAISPISRAEILGWLSPSFTAHSNKSPLCVTKGTRFTDPQLVSGALRTGGPGASQSGSEKERTALGTSSESSEPQLSPLDFADLGLVKESGVNGIEKKSSKIPGNGEGHFMSNTRGCGNVLERNMRDSFEQVYSILAADLERASMGDSVDLQLAIIGTWHLRLVPDDHEFLSRIGIFRILHQVLSNARQAFGPLELEQQAEFSPQSAFKIGRQMSLLLRQRVMKITLLVVHLLASQVVLHGGETSQDTSTTTFSLRSPTASLLGNLKKNTKPSGAETLGRSVFDMLFNELETALDSLHSNVENSVQQTFSPTLIIDEEEYCYQVVMLLYTIAINGMDTCSKFLTTSERIDILLSGASHTSVRIEHRTLRLLSRILPAAQDAQMIEDDVDVLSKLWDLVAAAYPQSLADVEYEYVHEDQELECNGSDHPLNEPKLAPTAQPKSVYRESLWRACDVISILRRLLLCPKWSQPMQDMMQRTIQEAKDTSASSQSKLLLWVTVGVLGGHFEQLRVCGKVRFAPALLARVDESFLGDMKALSRKAGVLSSLSGPGKGTARVLIRSSSSGDIDNESGSRRPSQSKKNMDDQSTQASALSSSSTNSNRATIRLMSATMDVDMLVPVSEVQVSNDSFLSESTLGIYVDSLLQLAQSALDRVKQATVSSRSSPAFSDDMVSEGDQGTITDGDEDEDDDGHNAESVANESEASLEERARFARLAGAHKRNEQTVLAAALETAGVKSAVDLARSNSLKHIITRGGFRSLLELASTCTETAGIQDIVALEAWWRAGMARYGDLNAELIQSLHHSRRSSGKQDPADLETDSIGNEDSNYNNEEEEIPPALQAMMDLGMGFPKEVCEVALDRCNNNIEDAIEFCLEHAMDMDVLVEAAAKNKKAKSEEIVNTRRTVIVNKLVEMGFPAKWCNRAIDVAGENFENALTWILSNGELLQAEDRADNAAAEAEQNDTDSKQGTPPGKHGDTSDECEENGESHSDLPDTSPETQGVFGKIILPEGVGVLTSTSGLEAMEVTEDLTVSVLKKAGGFPTVCARDLLLTSGCWYYEVTMLTDNCMQIGWIDAAYTGNAKSGDGVGDDCHSWSFDGYRQLAWHSKSHVWGQKWKVGDVISAAIDMDSGEMWFGLNGDYENGMGCMVRGLRRNETYVEGLCPAASLNRTERLQFNFGGHQNQVFKHQPPEVLRSRCRPIAEAFLSEHNCRSHYWPRNCAEALIAVRSFEAHQVEDCLEQAVPHSAVLASHEQYFDTGRSSDGSTGYPFQRRDQEYSRSRRSRRFKQHPKEAKHEDAEVGQTQDETLVLSDASQSVIDDLQVCTLEEAIQNPKKAVDKLQGASAVELVATLLSTSQALSCLYARVAVVLLLNGWSKLNASEHAIIMRDLESVEGGYRAMACFIKLTSGNQTDWTDICPTFQARDEDFSVSLSSGNIAEGLRMPVLDRLKDAISDFADYMRHDLIKVVTEEVARASMRLFGEMDWEKGSSVVQAFREGKKFNYFNVLNTNAKIEAERRNRESDSAGDAGCYLPSVIPGREITFQDEVIMQLPCVKLAQWLTTFLVDRFGNVDSGDFSEEVVVEIFTAWKLALHSPSVSLKTLAAQNLCDILQKFRGKSIVPKLLKLLPTERITKLTERYLELGGTTNPVQARFLKVLVELSTNFSLQSDEQAAKDIISEAMVDFDDGLDGLPTSHCGTIRQFPIPELLRERLENVPSKSLRQMVLENVNVGDLVVRGPHWKDGDCDGGPGGVGVVVRKETFGIVVDWNKNKADQSENDTTRDTLKSSGCEDDKSAATMQNEELGTEHQESAHEDDSGASSHSSSSDSHTSAEEDNSDVAQEADQASEVSENDGDSSRRSDATESQTGNVPKSDESAEHENSRTSRSSESTLVRTYSLLGTGPNEDEWEVLVLRMSKERKIENLCERDFKLEFSERAKREAREKLAFYEMHSNNTPTAVLGDRLRHGAMLWLKELEGNQVSGKLDLPIFQASVAVSGSRNENVLHLVENELLRGSSTSGWISRFGTDAWQPGTEYTFEIGNDGTMKGSFRISLKDYLVEPSVNDMAVREAFALELDELEAKALKKSKQPRNESGSRSSSPRGDNPGRTRPQRIVLHNQGQDQTFSVDVARLDELGESDLLETLLRPLMTRGGEREVSHGNTSQRVIESIENTFNRIANSSGSSPRSQSNGGNQAKFVSESVSVTVSTSNKSGEIMKVELPGSSTVLDVLQTLELETDSNKVRAYVTGESESTPLSLYTVLASIKTEGHVALQLTIGDFEGNSLADTQEENSTNATLSGKVPLVVTGDVELSSKCLFSFDSDARGSSMILSADNKMVTLNPFDMDLRGVAFGSLGFSSGVHYFEVQVENAGADYGSVFIGVAEKPPGVYAAGTQHSYLKRWDRVPASFGYVNFRATLETHAAHGQGNEQIYGEFYGTGDTVGVCVDMDRGILSFFLDGIKYGQHTMKDLGIAFHESQLYGKSDARLDRSNPLTLFPMIGLRRSRGDTVKITGKWMSIPGRSASRMLKDVHSVNALLRESWLLKDGQKTRKPPSKEFLERAWRHYRRWARSSKPRFLRYLSRAYGQVVEVDTSDEACLKASGAELMLGDGRKGLRAGDRVKILQSCGRDLEAPEEAIVIGAFRNRIWYKVDSQHGGGHDGMEEGAGAVWYWDPEELGMLEVLSLVEESQDVSSRSATEAQDSIDSFEEFARLVSDARWTGATDAQLVQYLNEQCNGMDPLNLQLEQLEALSLVAVDDNTPVLSPQTSFLQSESSPEEHLSQDSMISRLPKTITVSRKAVVARAALLRLLNSMVRRCLPFITLENGKKNSLGWVLGQTRQILLTWTKKSFWEAVLSATTTPTPLATDEYEDPQQIRLVNVNRIRAAPPKLASLLSPEERVEASVFGQLYNEISKWGDHTLRRAYVGKGHGGQKRAFKVKFLGEGVKDYGGPYRAVFEQVADELENDHEWPDSRMDCLLPLFVPCPNRYNSTGDVGRDKFVFNPSREARNNTNLKGFAFLGKLVGMAIRHGLQMGLDLPALYWRKLASLEVFPAHLGEVDKVFGNTMKVISEKLTSSGPRELNQSSAEAMAENLGVERFLEVSISDGSMVPVVPGGEEIPLDYENAQDYIRLAEQVRLNEADPQLLEFKNGLASVVPVQLFSLFTEQELEVLVCGKSQMDIALLKQCTDYEGVKADDPHVVLFWEVLEGFDDHQRTEFLRFAWARSRMPNTAADMPMNFKITAPTGGAVNSPDDYLPSAQTCFFSLSLPRYTSKEVMKSKLLTAITCTLMDNDFRPTAAEGWADV